MEHGRVRNTRALRGDVPTACGHKRVTLHLSYHRTLYVLSLNNPNLCFKPYFYPPTTFFFDLGLEFEHFNVCDPLLKLWRQLYLLVFF
ncbi:MAG: hypothetical protein S4CHLAM123_01620 [Chlamydiales bacterium]|nr:hypothetical protein [Chlamydiales bacterium]